MTLLGELARRMALLFLAWTVVTCFLGAKLGRQNFVASGRHAMYATGILITLAAMARIAEPHGQTSEVVLPFVLSLSYVTTALPFAVAAGAAGQPHRTYRSTRRWAGMIQRWLLASWLCMTMGVMLTWWVAYTNPTFNADWLNAPLRNGVLAPWLVGGSLLYAIDRYHTRKSHGRLLVAGAVLLLLGVGMTYHGQRIYHATIGPGTATTLDDAFGHPWRFASDGISMFDTNDCQVITVPLRVTHANRPLHRVTSEQHQCLDTNGNPLPTPHFTADTYSTVGQSLYATITNLGSDQSAEWRIVFTPLLWCVWLGGFLMELGALVAWWPPRGGYDD